MSLSLRFSFQLENQSDLEENHSLYIKHVERLTGQGETDRRGNYRFRNPDKGANQFSMRKSGNKIDFLIQAPDDAPELMRDYIDVATIGMSLSRKKDFLEELHRKQKAGLLKDLLAELAAENLKLISEQSDEQLKVGEKRDQLTQFERKRKQPLKPEAPRIGLQAGFKQTITPDLDIMQLKKDYLEALEKNIKAYNDNILEGDANQKLILNHENIDDTLLCTIHNLNKDNIKVTIENDFNATAEVVSKENVALLAIAAKSYIDAKVKQLGITPQEANDFTLTCKDEDEGKQLQKLFAQHGVTINNFNYLEPKPAPEQVQQPEQQPTQPEEVQSSLKSPRPRSMSSPM